MNNQIVLPPEFDAANAYFAIEAGRVVAYEMTQGVQKWIANGSSDVQPTAGGGLLFLADRSTLTALKTSDGAVAWQLPLTDPLSVPPLWDDGWLIVATKNRDIVAISAPEGRSIWSRPLRAEAHARPAAEGNRLYVPTTDGRVVALQRDTGEPVWERTVGAAANDILTLGERLYVGSNDNRLYCIMTKDGAIDWKWPTGGDVIGQPVHDEHNVYFVSRDNVLRALDLKSGGQRWKTALPLRPSHGPALAGDTLIVTGMSSKIVAYTAKEGKPAGDLPAAGELAAAPRVVGEGPGHTPKLIIVTRDIAKGATVVALTRSIDPPVVPLVPLPNLTQVTPPKS